MVQALLDAIGSAPPALAYTVIGLLVFSEAAFFLGFVIPGETAVLFGGLLASQGHLEIRTLIVVVVVSAILGDTVGYEVGRHLGPRVLKRRILERHQERIANAQALLRRRGGPAVFAGRWTAFLRAVMPGLAGLSRMPYGVFLLWNALGGVAWGVAFSLIGYLAGASYQRIASAVGTGAAVVVAVAVVVGLVVWQIRRRRREDDAEDTGEAEEGA